ncbi:ATP-dependent Clp protease proteolytic subunit [uncultured Desulfovibrio sp.]|uniref:ATP-dependent Clp protease proteolytic subunit n=1 Tax=uncultured Desulfovibrio sp. TaxID=167968 RepID=UPI002711E085|nr:ATP-dependent Clp protease proteolytic subunit [uncultured Desulfovibrio sp.]
MMPLVIETQRGRERLWDMYSRLLRDRIILLDEPIEDKTASMVCAQLLFLHAEHPGAPIQLYINSPGGVVTAGLAIYDTMRHIASPVATLCMGQAASMAAVLLAAGEPGLRRALPSSRIMVHQPSGGFRGQATDAAIHTGEMLRLRAILDGILAACAGLAPDEVRSLTERDSYFSAPEARDLGLIDGIVRVR